MDMAINIMAAFEQETPAPTCIFPGFFPKIVGALIAPGGVGKTSWALQLALAVAGNSSKSDLLKMKTQNQPLA